MGGVPLNDYGSSRLFSRHPLQMVGLDGRPGRLHTVDADHMNMRVSLRCMYVYIHIYLRIYKYTHISIDVYTVYVCL